MGQRIPRIEAPDKVTGRAPYTADVLLPGALWGALFFAEYPDAFSLLGGLLILGSTLAVARR